MKTLLTFTVAGVLLGTSFAQETKIDPEAQKRSIQIIERWVKEREAQIAELSDDILQLHKRMDDRLSRMVDRLAEVKDSVRSGHRVGNMKTEVIEGLEKAVEAFRSKRMALSLKLQEGRSVVPTETVQKEISHYDEHMDLHIQQMLKLSKSFTQDENVKKYESLSADGGGGGDHGYGSSGYDYGWYSDPIEISDDWRQNLHDRYMDKKQRDEVKGALEKSIVRCNLRIRGLRFDLEQRNLSEIDQKVIQSELDAHLAMLDKRQRQVEDLLVVEKPHTTEVTRDAANDLTKAVRDLMNDVERDVRTLSLKHTQLNSEREKVAKLEANLEARRKWLEENTKKDSQ